MTHSFKTYSFGSIADLYIEYMKRSEPFTMPNEHYHDYYEVYYMLSGQRIYFIHDRSYSVEQGDLVFINKLELHKTIQIGEAAHERAIVHFNTHLFNRMSTEQIELLLSPFQQLSHVIRLPRHEQLAVDQLMRHMLNEIQQKQPGYELIPGQAFTELLLTVARYLKLNEPTPLHLATPIHAKISEIVRYINENFSEQLRLTALSERFFISPYYLSRMFKEITGFAFSDYVVLTRIKEAQRLLRETTMTISDIATAVGFDNFSHFGKTFKKIAHASPREYRNNMS